MTDKDLAAIFSLNGNNGRPGQLEAFDDFNAVEDRPAALAPGLVSLGFIRAAIRRTALFWCALGVVGLVVGIGINKEYPAAYKASTSVLITYGPNDNPTSAVLDNQAIAESRSVAELALRKLGLQESVASFAAATTVAVVTDRVLANHCKCPVEQCGGEPGQCRGRRVPPVPGQPDGDLAAAAAQVAHSGG